MPNIKSAKKRLKVAAKARERNRRTQSVVKNARRRFMDTDPAAEGGQAQEVYQRYCSFLDKAAGKGVIKKNTAIRRKRRAANRLRRAAPPAATTAE